jgi:site-specific DNA-methyltransferase (adenine-specific)
MLKLNDLKSWEDAKNKVLCCDCLEYMKMMPDKCVDLILTDPPYGIEFRSNMRVMSKKFDKLENDNNEMRFDAFKEVARILKDNSVIMSFCSFKNYADDYNELKKYFSIKNCIIWNKGGGGIGDLTHSLSTDYEMAIIGHKGMCQIRGKRDGSVWDTGKVNPNTMVHPTEKPKDLIIRMIDKFSDKEHLIFDPFMGSWTTARACKDLGRNFIGCELSEEYCKIGEQRLRQDNLF